MEPLISADALSKHYLRGAQKVCALDQVSFSMDQGEFLAIVGPSGSGKSTLLNLLGGMDTPTSGLLRVAGQDLSRASEAMKVDFRRHYIGFVFQHFGLMPALNVEQNIALPGAFAPKAAHEDVEMILEKLGLAGRRHHRPGELSGGEMQRVAIGRALYHKPKLLLADEPTGNLDSVTAESILQLLLRLNREGLTVVVVTHNETLARAARRRIGLKDGRIQADESPKAGELT